MAGSTVTQPITPSSHALGHDQAQILAQREGHEAQRRKAGDRS